MAVVKSKLSHNHRMRARFSLCKKKNRVGVNGGDAVDVVDKAFTIDDMLSWIGFCTS